MKINQIIVDESLQLGDNFDIELNNLIIESRVVGFMDDGVVIEADDKALALLGLSGALLESVNSGKLSSRKQDVVEGSDISGLMTAASMVKDYIVTAEVDGKVKKFRVRGMTGPNAAKERFLKHASMAKVMDVKPAEQGVAEGLSDIVKGVKRSIKGKEHPDVVAAKHLGRAMGHYNQGDIKSGDKESNRYVKTRDIHLKARGVAEGSGKNVVKSVKVGNFRHDLVDTGMGWQVRIYNGDELYDTGLSKNSEQKGLAALDDAVAYTEKQLRTKSQGVAEGHYGWDDPQYDEPKRSNPHAEEPRRDDTDDAPTKIIYRVWDGKKYVGDKQFDRVEDAIAFRASLPGGKDMSIQQAEIYVTPVTDWEVSDRDDERDYWQDKIRHGDFNEAEYQGRKVPLGKPMQGDVKKSKVYVKGPKGNVVKVNFGDKNMKIKKSNPKRRKSFRARHNCANPGPRWKARYWSCRAW